MIMPNLVKFFLKCKQRLTEFIALLIKRVALKIKEILGHVWLFKLGSELLECHVVAGGVKGVFL